MRNPKAGDIAGVVRTLCICVVGGFWLVLLLFRGVVACILQCVNRVGGCFQDEGMVGEEGKDSKIEDADDH